MLTGACMGRSGFNRKTALATVTMVLAAEAADIDVLWSLRGSIAGLQHHRGITHSFVGVPYGRRCARTRVAVASLPGSPHRLSITNGPPVRWGFLYFCALLAALSHLLLDYTTAYGIRLFEPFNYRWYSWDIVYIVEPLMLLALIAGLAIPGLLGLVSQEVGARSKVPRGRGGAIAALVFVVLLWGVRDYQHRRAIAALNSFLYHQERPRRVGAYPYMINPFRWHGVVETTGFFETVPVNSSGRDVDHQAGIQFYKHPQTGRDPGRRQLTLWQRLSRLGGLSVYPGTRESPGPSWIPGGVSGSSLHLSGLAPRTAGRTSCCSTASCA